MHPKRKQELLDVRGTLKSYQPRIGGMEAEKYSHGFVRRNFSEIYDENQKRFVLTPVDGGIPPAVGSIHSGWNPL